MTEKRSVKEMWWEDNDLHMIDADTDEHIVFRNAHVLDMEAPTEDNICKEEQLTFTARLLKH